MHRKIAKATGMTLLTLVIAAGIIIAAFFWRLSQGAVSLDFMTARIEQEINTALDGVTVKIGGAVFELDNGTHVPHFRLRDVVMRDSSGDLIARSEKAAVTFETAALLQAKLVPRKLDLIGTRILVKRKNDGSVVLGFGTPQSIADVAPQADTAAPSQSSGLGVKGDREEGEFGTGTDAHRIIEILAGSGDGTSSASGIDRVSISNASLQIYDEINHANWFVPDAELKFKRLSTGFQVAATAAVANDTTNIPLEFAASYEKSKQIFQLSARVEDVVPAKLADKFFGMEQLSNFNIPLSGHIEIEMSEAGIISRASAEISAAAGSLNLPNYFADPVVIDEGALRLEYDPVSTGFNIVDSMILMGGSRADISGSVRPLRSSEGQLTDIAVNLKASNVSVDTQGTVINPVLVDKVELIGSASLEKSSLSVEDFTIMSGTAGLRMRGFITAGHASPGYQLSGRVRDLSSDFIKKLWPPILGKRARGLVLTNLMGGVVTDGTFLVNIAPDDLAKAMQERKLSPEQMDLKFSLKDFAFKYFKALPPLAKATGAGHFSGDTFVMTLNDAVTALPSGATIQARKLTFRASGLMDFVPQGQFWLDLSADDPALMEFANLPDLDLLHSLNLNLPKITGNSLASIIFSLPMKADVARSEIQSSATINLDNGAVNDIIPGVDMTDAKIEAAMEGQAARLKGTMKLNDVPSTLSWSRANGDSGKGSATLTTIVDELTRAKLGLGLESYISGPVKVTANVSNIGSAQQDVDVEIDLSKNPMQIEAIGWSRPATAGTLATFDVVTGEDKGHIIKNLAIKGPDLSVKGDIVLSADNSFKSAVLSQVWLSDENNFSFVAKQTESGQAVQVKGASFDARPLLTTMLKAGAKTSTFRSDMTVKAELDRVIAHRGEVVKSVLANLTMRGGSLSGAEISGSYLSGLPLAIHLSSSGSGRQLQATSSDGGATLRAINLYSKVAGGEMNFNITMPYSVAAFQTGQLVLKNFEVRNEAALAELDPRGRPQKSGPRSDGITFSKLTLPFTMDAQMIRIRKTYLKGSQLGAVAEGVVQKTTGQIDVTGTMIPAYGLNSVVDKIPIFGRILSGGKGQGIIGVTFALDGNYASPTFHFNPISAIAPGIFRSLFEYDNNDSPPQRSGHSDRN